MAAPSDLGQPVDEPFSRASVRDAMEKITRTEALSVLPVAQERAHLSKRLTTQRVRVNTRIVIEQTSVQTQLEHRNLVIDRVAVEREVPTMPENRHEGDLLIISVVEERLVKRLFVVEEIHIRQHRSQHDFNQTVALRTERADIEEDIMADPTTTATTDLAPAGHDVHLYDPNIHDNQIVAVYDTLENAEAARAALVTAGVDVGAIEVTYGTAPDEPPDSQGFWGSVKSLFAPDEDAHAFGHAMGRGHVMLVVHPALTANRPQIIEVLEGSNPIDFDSKLEEWRQAGYDYRHAGQDSLRTETPTGDATGSSTAMGAVMAAGVGGAMMSGTMPVVTPTAQITATDGSTDTIAAGTAAQSTPARPGADTIKVLQERLRIGKREVAAGSVRVRSYVIERPVEEQVRLHEERINVRRTPVDRAATGAEDTLFQERTIEARAMSEEAVINKEVRIVEEIGLEKETTERTETVRETVRETKVELEDTTKVGKTTATPGTETSGGNSPRP